MRFLAVFLLIGAVLGAGCNSPDRIAARPAATERSSRPDTASHGWQPANVLALPAGLSDEGLEPRVAFGKELREAWVVGTGTIERILRDDTKRPRHQRFIVRADPGSTLLFAHNIDQAPRVPLKRGDTIAFRGKYVWNEQGGVVHWTHRDRRDANGGGWILWKGQNFR